MMRKIALYAALIGSLAALSVWWNGTELRVDRVASAMIFTTVAAWAIWLRWDWAPEQRRKKDDR